MEVANKALLRLVRWSGSGAAIWGRLELPSQMFAVYAIRLARAVLAAGCVSWLEPDIKMLAGRISAFALRSVKRSLFCRGALPVAIPNPSHKSLFKPIFKLCDCFR